MSWKDKLMRSFSKKDHDGAEDEITKLWRSRSHIPIGDLSKRFNVQEKSCKLFLTEKISHHLRQIKIEDFIQNEREQISSFLMNSEFEGDEIKKFLNAEAQRIFQKFLRQFEDGGQLVEVEVRDLAKRLSIADDEFVSIFNKFRSEVAQKRLDLILDDGVISNDEFDALMHMKKRLLIENFGDATELQISRARRRWQVLNDPLEAIDPPILLHKHEKCFFHTRSQALEMRERTTRVDFAGPTARLKIAPGVFFRLGSIKLNRAKESYTHSFGSGTLCVTSKRVFWVGPQKTISFPLSSIVDYESYTDGIMLQKSRGKPITFIYDEDEEGLATIYLTRIITEHFS